MAIAATTQPTLTQLLRQRPGLRQLLIIRVADELGAQTLNVAVGWRIYAQTHDPMSLAYVGLAQFAPIISLGLFAGQAADRYDRGRIVTLSLTIQALCLVVFCGGSAASALPPGAIYLLLLVIGAARAFAFPAMAALLPHAVEGDEFPRAVALSSSAFQLCWIVGPAIGGLLYAINGSAMFAAIAGLFLFAATKAAHLVGVKRVAGDAPTDEGLLAGIAYIRSNRLLLALVSLDLFAVLLGGVGTLLPIYAKDILSVGPIGLGCLRCAPGVGAAAVGCMLTGRAIARGAGGIMLACVAGFGLATVVFALSGNFWLSLGALAVAGGFDMVSMVIRQTLVQVATPDAMRGRVSAVNGMFIGASSELGGFESGAVAALFGAAPAALLGGIGTLLIVALWAALFPELRGANDWTPPTPRRAAGAIVR